MGRLHRHERGVRPDTAQTPVCYVITDEYTNMESASRKIYSHWLINKTADTLPDSITLPDDISPLVQEVYSVTSGECYDKYINEQKKSKGRADCFRISKPKGKSIHGLLSKPVETGDEQLAQVRKRQEEAAQTLAEIQKQIASIIVVCVSTSIVFASASTVCSCYITHVFIPPELIYTS